MKSYIYKLTKRVKPEFNSQKQFIEILNEMAHGAIVKLKHSAAEYAAAKKQVTMLDSHVIYAIKQHVSGEDRDDSLEYVNLYLEDFKRKKQEKEESKKAAQEEEAKDD